MLSHNASNKAQRYLSLLDEARCDGNWEEASRLKLKIAKHVPQRKCLQVIIATECVLSAQSFERPSTSSSLPFPDYSQKVPEILTALKYGNPTPEDTFQAEVCLSWLHWTIGEPSLALSRLPTHLEQIPHTLGQNGETLAGWTHVCIVKGAYIRGLCQENVGNLPAAVENYESILPYVRSGRSSFGTLPAHRIWTQRLLGRHCMLSSQHIKSKSQHPKDLLSPSSLLAPAFLLAPFRAWNDFWEVPKDQHEGPLVAEVGWGNISRRLVWQNYYETMSTLLQLEATYPSLSAGSRLSGKGPPLYETKFFSKPKSEQLVELINVQSTCEKLLMHELGFPKANESTPEIESWAVKVIANWKIICGPTWRDEDHSNGGKETTGRLVLDILYRAATRSFHSTRILRHLFTVHASLADFYLASKALDSYFEIIIKGKARFEKSGKHELALDDNVTAIKTAAAGITMLCLYGRRKDVERAQELATILEKWLQQIRDDISLDIKEINKSVQQAETGTKSIMTIDTKRQALVTGFCALGICRAQWANLTHETSCRADLQAEAILNLRTALRSDLENESTIEILYPLASVLAKTRDIDLAIKELKNGLSNSTTDCLEENGKTDAEAEPDSFPNSHKRRLLLKSWHLLALLLSAKQNFSTAVTSCEAALELYGFYSRSSGRSPTRGLNSAIEFCDRISIIEIKMTQLALAEVIDGPEEAVSACEELLSLYATIFNYSEKQISKSTVSAPDSPPASRHGTIKSFRGSFLGRSKESRVKSSGSGPVPRNLDSGSFAAQEPPKTMVRTPTISITSEDSTAAHNNSHHSHHLFHHESKKLHKRSNKGSESTIRKSRASSLNIVPNGLPHSSSGLPLRQSQHGLPPPPPSISNEIPGLDSLSCEPDEVGVAITHDEPTSPRPSTVRHSLPPVSPFLQFTTPPQSPLKRNFPMKQASLVQQNLDPGNRPSSFDRFTHPPVPLFSPSDQIRQSLTLLTKIWLQIASVYRRASMPTDAQGALSEAQTHISVIEAAIATAHSSTEAFVTPGWGGLKSVSELWADALTEQGRLREMLGNRVGAENDYEKALTHFPDHPGAIVGLSNLLLDFYEKSFPSPSPPLAQEEDSHPAPLLASLPSLPSSPPSIPPNQLPPPTLTPTLDHNEPNPDPETSTLIPRLCARDRAYGLLSSLTKSGAGWDCAEAWFALARAYELGGQVAKATEALWWVVRLEDTRPVREWPSLGC